MTRGQKLTAFIIVVIVLVGGVAIWRLHTNAAANTPVGVVTNSGWKIYQDNTNGLSFEYPPTFEATSTTYNGYSVTRVYDPSTNAGYISITTVNDPSQGNDPTVKEIFTGPYPKQLPAASNDSAMTIEQRTLNGLQGIEMYGYIAEGSEYSDEFMYRNNHLWEINLDPVLEGRITAYPQPGTPTPDKQTYEKILASIKISS